MAGKMKNNDDILPFSIDIRQLACLHVRFFSLRFELD